MDHLTVLVQRRAMSAKRMLQRKAEPEKRTEAEALLASERQDLFVNLLSMTDSVQRPNQRTTSSWTLTCAWLFWACSVQSDMPKKQMSLSPVWREPVVEGATPRWDSGTWQCQVWLRRKTTESMDSRVLIGAEWVLDFLPLTGWESRAPSQVASSVIVTWFQTKAAFSRVTMGVTVEIPKHHPNCCRSPVVRSVSLTSSSWMHHCRVQT